MSKSGFFYDERTSDSQWFEFVISVVAGLIAAIALRDRLTEAAFWGGILGAAGVGFLLAYWARHQLYYPKSRVELESSEASQLADSILSPKRASYAINTNWIDLWRSDAFTYYLSLDQVSSLIIYTKLAHSPLGELTADNAEKDEFIEDCKSLMRKLGATKPPVGQHRVRILIYPQKVYDKYASRFIGLLRLHAVARMPCIPLVSELLEEELTSVQLDAIRNLSRHQLKQSLVDKIPPQPRLNQRRIMRDVEEGKTTIFPDLLLIDPDEEVRDRHLWWYNDKDVKHVAGDVSTITTAHDVFRTICAEGEKAIWTNFTASNLGNIPSIDNRAATSSELFFTLDYYKRWLLWIREHASHDPNAKVLSTWLEEEHAALGRFIAERVDARNGGASTSTSVSVIDVGCGFGRHLLQLGEDFPVLTGLGVDVIPNMTAQASHDARVGGLEKRLYFCQDDATELAAARDGEFDVAICLTNTLGNMSNQKVRQALGQIRRVLKPQGSLFVSVYAPQSVDARLKSYQGVGLHVQSEGKFVEAAEGLVSAYFDRQEMVNLLSASGFTVNTTKELATVGFVVEGTSN